jgi:dihydropteroate synthase
VVGTVYAFLEERLKFGVKNGIKRERFIIDPGMGAFISSNPKYSLQILKNLSRLKKLGPPILVGPSRKSFIGAVLNLPVGERLEGSLTCAAVAAINGANIIRAHDVKETKRIIMMVQSIINS